jgi:hypothetical protein
MYKMYRSPKLLLMVIPSSIGWGMTILPTNGSPPPSQIAPMPTEWKVQSVQPPNPNQISIHRVFLDRQKQRSNRDFSCDCNGCRLAAAQKGIKIN